MQIASLAVGLIVIVFATLLLADGILSYVDPSSQSFSLGAVKGIVGLGLGSVSCFLFSKSQRIDNPPASPFLD